MTTGFRAGSRRHVLAALSIHTLGAVLVAAVVIAGLASTTIVQAQTVTDPTPSANSMVVSGFAPVAAGASVTIEALDPTTIKAVECGRVQTQAATAAPAGTSRFAVRALWQFGASGGGDRPRPCRVGTKSRAGERCDDAADARRTKCSGIVGHTRVSALAPRGSIRRLPSC